MSILQTFFRFILSSSKTQACGLTIIGIGMLIFTDLAEALEHRIVREFVQMAIILVGILGTGLLFAPKSRDRHPD